MKKLRMLVLVLVLGLAAAPAQAGLLVPAAGSWLGEVLAWVLHWTSAEIGGGIDTNGLRAGAAGEGEIGGGIDPDG